MSCGKGCVGARHDFDELDRILDEYKEIEGSLITVLQKAQGLFGYLSLEVIDHIAAGLKIKPAKIYGVATFYTQFRFEPIGKYLISLCMGTACHVNGAEMIKSMIFDELGITDGETTEDGMFTLMCVACIGCCSLSPVMSINDDIFGHLTRDKLIAAFESKKSAERQESAL